MSVSLFRYGLALAAAVPLLSGVAVAQEPLVIEAPSLAAPLLPFPHLPAVSLDTERNVFGSGQGLVRERGLQARMIWIDATANLDRINTAAKVQAVVEQIRKVGFNTIVLDVKPIIGETLHVSKFAPKLTQWTKAGVTKSMPADFDPLREMVRVAKDAGLGFYVSLNAFSEGHSYYPGRGAAFERPEWQTTYLETELRVRANGEEESAYLVSDKPDAPPRQLDDLSVYTNATRLPRLAPGAAVAVLDPGGRVVSLLDAESMGPVPPEIPAGGALLVGFTQASGDFLREKATPQVTLELLSRPAFVPASARLDRQIPVMTNPHLPEVQKRIVDMAVELVANYPVDGIVFDDRLRFAARNADFSDVARAAFEGWMRRKVSWPEDILRWETTWPSLARREVPGPLYDHWATFRALTLRNFLVDVIRNVRGARSGVQVGTYVGSWYPDYPDIGANWAADDFEPGYRFADRAWRQTGWSPLVDFVITGCYYTVATIREAAESGKLIGATVEAAGQFSNRAVNDQTWVYAGLSLDQFKGNPDGLRRALQAAAATTQGIMCFDLSHDIDPMWPLFEEAFRTPAKAPHQVPGLRAELTRKKQSRRQSGAPAPPVILYTGVSGTGF